MVNNYDYSDANAFTTLLSTTDSIETSVRTEITTILNEQSNYDDKYAYAFDDEAKNCNNLMAYEKSIHVSPAKVKCEKKWKDSNRDILLFQHVLNWMSKRDIALENGATAGYWTNEIIKVDTFDPLDNDAS